MIPGYVELTVLNYNSLMRMSLVRSQLNGKPTLCKSSTEYSVTENRLLEREYQILKSIYAYYDIYPESESKPVPDRSSSPTRLSRDLILEQLVVKRIPYPLSLQKLENRNALLFKDTKFGPIDLGGEAAVDIMNGVRIGLYITQALDILHKAKFIHLNVCPETILAKYSCDNEVEDAMLFDYRIAIEMGKDVELPGTIDENTKYISPEQTGRLDKMIDTRSDIYSLGITLWELIVGKHPFEDVAEDEMVYSHIAKEIEPAHKANPLIPPIISEIVAKMIKKDATERYQTVGAVYHDLERVLNHYKSLPSDANFLVEMSKIQLEIGSKDYHREIRMNGLVCGFENLISEFSVILKDLKSRPSEVVFLKGGAKSGKMTLVQQVLKVVNQANGHLFVAKSVQASVKSQYTAFVTAIDVYLKYLMCQPEVHLNNFRSNIQKKLNREGLNTLTHFFPTIKLILGNKTRANSDTHVSQRFICAIEMFMQCILLQDPLLVFYMGKCSEHDESVNLIYELVSRKNTYGTMFIFDVVDTGMGPLKTLSSIPTTSTITINPLTEKEISCFLSQCICPPLGELDELAKTLWKKSRGNPFYLKEQLIRCQEQKLIVFDEKRHGWHWDIKKIEDSLLFSENVVTNVMTELEKLDSEIIEILCFSAVLGMQIDIEFVQKVYNENIHVNAFETAQQLAIIRPSTLVTKKELILKNNRRMSVAAVVPQTKFEFIHVSIREHFAQKFDTVSNFVILLAAAKLWFHENVGLDFPKKLIEKINSSLSLVTEYSDLEFLFDLNCEIIAKHSSGSPQELLSIFMAIEEIIAKAPEYFWTKRRENVFDIKIEAAKSYLLHQGNDAIDLEAFESEISPYAATPEDHLQILKIHLKFLLKNDKNAALEYSTQKLAKVCDLNFESSQTGMLNNEINELIRGRATQEVLSDIKKQVELRYVLILEILSMLAIAFRDEEDTLYILALHATLLTLQHGYSSFCSLMIPLMMRYYLSPKYCLQIDSFLWWSEFCTKLLQQQTVPDIMVMSRYISRKGMSMIWSCAQSLEYLQKTWLLDGYLFPDMELRLYETYVMLMLSCGRSLTEIQSSPKELGPRAVFHSIDSNLRYLQGQIMATLSKKKFEKTEEFPYSAGYLQVFHSCIYESWSQVENSIELISKIESYWSGTPLQIDLLLFQIHLNTSGQHDEMIEKKADDVLKRIDELVHLSPSREHECKLHLAKAMNYQFCENMSQAIKFYELSIDSSVECKNTWVQAWASELQANYWTEQNLKRLAAPCYISSFQMWSEWGSAGKVSELKMKQPLLVNTVSRHTATSGRSRTFSKAKTFKIEKEEKTMDLDLSTIIKVTNSLSNEKNLKELLNKLMSHMMTNTGATKTVVMLTQDSQLFCNAMAYLDSDGKIKTESLNQAVEKTIVPISIVYYVLRSGELVVHNDTISTRYDQDEYLDSASPKSIFCCPIKHQDDTSGVLYLENKSQLGAFTQNRCQLVESLMASVSISIANMKLTQLNQELSHKLNTSKKEQAPKFNFDAPITRVLVQLQTLKDRFQTEGDFKETEKLDEVITLLNSDSLFTAQFDHVNDENGETLDQDTRSWLQSTLQHRILVESNSAKSSLTNVKLEPDPVPDSSDLTHQYQLTPYHDFDMFHYSILTQGKPLYYQCMHMLRKYKVQEHLPIPELQARQFFQRVELEYHNLPYHNSTHAADLLKSMEALLLDTELASKFSHLEIFGMIVAGAIHDMDHPGVNNQFLVTVHHPISILYNDVSVLENHHASRGFDIAMTKDANIFSKLKTDQFVVLRKIVIQLVLATDLSQHFQIINKFKQRIQNGLKLEEVSDRSLCMEMSMKLGDLNNPTKPFQQSQKWAICVMQEFFMQVSIINKGDRERILGFPISKFMDRHDTCIPKCQLGFIDVLVTPLYDAWYLYHSSNYVKDCIQHLIENRERWKQMPENALEECKAQQWISLDETLDMTLPHVDFGHSAVTTTPMEKQKRVWSMTAKGEDAPSRYFGSGIKGTEIKTRPMSLQPPRLSATRQRSNTNPGPLPFVKFASGLANVTSIESMGSVNHLKD